MALVRSVTTIHFPDNVTVGEGSILDDNDPIVRRHPHFFEPVEAVAQRDAGILDATARPGIRRGRK